MYDLAHAYEVWPVPARFRTCKPSEWAAAGQYDYPHEWGQARSWLVDFRRYLDTARDPRLIGHGIVLAGPAGTGKTMLAAACLNFLRSKGFSVGFVRDGDLMRLVRLQYPSDEEVDLLGYLQRSACVVVDDLGRTGGAVEVIEPFLRYRMDEGKPTIVTMNNTVSLTPTLGSFLHEFTYVVFAGEDRRIVPVAGHGEW